MWLRHGGRLNRARDRIAGRLDRAGGRIRHAIDDPTRTVWTVYASSPHPTDTA